MSECARYSNLCLLIVALTLAVSVLDIVICACINSCSECARYSNLCLLIVALTLAAINSCSECARYSNLCLLIVALTLAVSVLDIVICV